MMNTADNNSNIVHYYHPINGSLQKGEMILGDKKWPMMAIKISKGHIAFTTAEKLLEAEIEASKK